MILTNFVFIHLSSIHPWNSRIESPSLPVGLRASAVVRKSGATVCVIDKQPGDHFVGDIADRLFKLFFADGASIVNISSSRDRISQPQTESNTSAKGSIAALTHALAVSLAGNQMIYHGDNGWRLE